MTLMHNEFYAKPEVFFISYDEVIRNPYPLLLQNILQKYRSSYEPFLNLETIENMDLENLTRFCMQRPYRNLFDNLAKIEFDTAGALKELLDKFNNIYEVSELLTMGELIPRLISQKFTEIIYIYSEVYDVRIHMDIQKSFNNMTKVNYVTGDLGKVLDAIPHTVTTFVLNDIMDISTIVYKKKADYSNILVAHYGYNYTLDDDHLVYRLNIEGFAKDNVFKFATFTPAELTEKHFTIL